MATVWRMDFIYQGWSEPTSDKLRTGARQKLRHFKVRLCNRAHGAQINGEAGPNAEYPLRGLGSAWIIRRGFHEVSGHQKQGSGDQ